MTEVICPECKHTQRLYSSTMRKIRAYEARTIRCSHCHAKIRIVSRKSEEVTD